MEQLVFLSTFTQCEVHAENLAYVKTKQNKKKNHKKRQAKTENLLSLKLTLHLWISIMYSCLFMIIWWITLRHRYINSLAILSQCLVWWLFFLFWAFLCMVGRIMRLLHPDVHISVRMEPMAMVSYHFHGSVPLYDSD